ncbi:MAG: DUF368 domain-containing protein [Lachnospiraceae bacterium]|nr:DUF368 domain-containing protein [Lachnospiraceae bacterium]
MDRFLILKAFLIGGSMLIPGVSGGTMSMILGVYEKLIAAVSAPKKENLFFLLQFAAGAAAAFLLLAGPMAALNRRFPQEMAFFVLGAILGGVPVIYKEAGNPPLSRKTMGYLGAGIFFVFLCRFLPGNIFGEAANTPLSFLVQFLAGVLGALALVLPGISFSSMLYMMGVYDFVLRAMGKGQFVLMLPFLTGILAGVFCLTRFLAKAMKQHPTVSYMVILGFVTASLWDIFEALPAMPAGERLVLCLFLSISGFLITWLLSKADSSVD